MKVKFTQIPPRPEAIWFSELPVHSAFVTCAGASAIPFIKLTNESACWLHDHTLIDEYSPNARVYPAYIHEVKWSHQPPQEQADGA